MAEEITRLILFDYLHIYSVHGVCQRNVQRTLLFTAYLVRGRLWPFALFCFAVSFSCLSYPLARIFAMLDYLDFFCHFYYSILQIIKA